MTESSFPFQGTAVADGPPDFEETRGNRRTVLILAVVGLLVVGALAYFFVFSGGDDATDESLPTPRSTRVQTTPTPTPTAAPVKAPKLSKKAFGKDPFKPLVVAPVGGTGEDAPAGGTTGGGSTTITTGGGVTTITTGKPVPAGGGTTAGGSTSTTPLTVKVVSVAADNSSGRVTVGTKSYSIAV